MKTQSRLFWICQVTLLILWMGTAFAVELTDNLICDGGMESWLETSPQKGDWNYLAVSCKAVEFTRDEKDNILTPKIFSQAYETRIMKQETHDVHSGQKALRFKGQFYLNGSSGDAFNTQEGDIYVVRYWAKGEGQTLMHMHVYGDAITQILESKGKPSKDHWSLIEERIQVVGRAPTTIYPRLWASEEMLIDDVFIGRVVREGERKLLSVPPDCQERVAFASETESKIVIDGKLDEPIWGKAIPFSGFRCHGDQSLLVAIQPNFRILFDAGNLYFGMEIPLANARQVLDELRNQPLLDGSGKPLSKDDTFTGRESIEFFIQAPGKSRYCQFVASLDGYHYDGAGMEGAWNGTWESAVSVADDRWFLEVKVPVKDLGIEKVTSAEGWRLNLCCDQKSGTGTWAAVGGAFHNPSAFGKLIALDFAKWCEQQPALRVKQRADILQRAGSRTEFYSERLTKIDASAPVSASATGKVQDWQDITRVYSQMDYIGFAYRCVEEDVRYRNFFE